MNNKLLLLILISVFTHPLYCLRTDSTSVIKYELNNNWQFKQHGKNDWHPATIPGCVHTDLLNNKLIPDPFFGTNEKDLQWIGENDWDYKISFNLPEETLKKKNIELVFEGLDTYADVYLNDSLILSADNMFRTWKVNCKDLLKDRNILSVHFNNVFKINLPKWKEAPLRLMAFSNNDQADTMVALYSRKAQFHYGWDWGPRFVTCGIWRSVYIQAWDEFKINDVQIIQKNVSKVNAGINSFINISADKNVNANIKVLVDGNEVKHKYVDLIPGINKIDVDFVLNKPKLWWTNGFGSHYLYTFKYLVSAGNRLCDSKEYKIGIRSLEVVRPKDSLGISFYVRLNGIPVFIKGASYIPQDNFQNRVTNQRYEYMVKSAADAHMNMLRVWGGGIYENDEFYNLCDQYGILVWQEFMFACAMYPTDSMFINSVKHEIVDNVTRLRNHSCVALYCGNNENEISWQQWGWKDLYSNSDREKYENNLHKLFYQEIPEALYETDSTRYYHHSSPSAGFNGVSPTEGDIHYWGVWHGKDPFDNFNKNIARFMSEYGFQSYPEINTIKKYALPEDLQLHSEVMLSHQRCMADNRKDKEYGNRLIQTYMERQYKQPKDFESYVYASQVLQAEGVKIAIEAHRRNMPFCMGTLYWQIDDCWPVASWSSIDYYGNWKALHFYLQKEYGTFLISPLMDKNNLNIYIISDSLEKVNARLKITSMDFNGKEIFSKTYNLSIKANKSDDYLTLSENELTKDNDKSKLFVTAQLMANGKLLTENTYFFYDPKKLELEKPDIKVSSVRNGDGYELTITSNKYAKDVYLSFENINGSFTENYFDLLPGVTKKIEFETRLQIDDFAEKLKIKSLVDSY
ncbi:MAG: glycoside hydrolase family 2 protein [Ignavibacteriaceae bacterium]